MRSHYLHPGRAFPVSLSYLVDAAIAMQNHRELEQDRRQMADVLPGTPATAEHRGAKGRCVMIRHGRFGLLSVLALALMLIFGAVTPVATRAQSSQTVVISASVVNVLELAVPSTVSFGNVPAAWNPADYPNTSGHLELTTSATVEVTSSLPYRIRLAGEDQSSGPEYDLDFILGFTTDDGWGNGLLASFTFAEDPFMLPPYQPGFHQNLWTFYFIGWTYAVPLPTGSVSYALTLQAAQV